MSDHDEPITNRYRPAVMWLPYVLALLTSCQPRPAWAAADDELRRLNGELVSYQPAPDEEVTTLVGGIPLDTQAVWLVGWQWCGEALELLSGDPAALVTVRQLNRVIAYIHRCQGLDRIVR